MGIKIIYNEMIHKVHSGNLKSNIKKKEPNNLKAQLRDINILEKKTFYKNNGYICVV